VAKLVTIFWRDIPAQVNAQEGRIKHQLLLSARFQRATQRAAVVSRQKNAHDFVKHWRRTDRPCGDDLKAEAAAEATRLEAAYPPERLAALVEAGGVEPSPQGDG
jgi:Virulence factor